MKLDFILAAIVVLCLLGLMGTLDLQAQQTAEAHKRETITAAKREFARRQADDRYGALYREAERMTFPVSAYRKDAK